MSKQTTAIKARWVFPGDADPLSDATIELPDDVCEAVRSFSAAVNSGPENIAVIPGLINAHTHLEFSDLQQPLGPNASFIDWIRNVVAHRRESDADAAQVIQSGIAECVALGTGTIGEIATRDGQPDANDSVRIVAFRECIAAMSDAVDDQLTVAAAHLALPRTDRFIPALSPHAPYTVHPDLFFGLTKLARAHSAPIAMHLFETRDELQFLHQAEGPFVDLLQQFGVWEAARATSMLQPLQYLQELATCENSLIVHGNYLTDKEIGFIAQHKSLSVVYCPRTHAWFGHADHPWQRLMTAGANVVIGTDSRASNPDLSVFNELKWLAKSFPAVSGRTLLNMATIHAARALGLANAGRVRAGQTEDLTVIRLPDINADAYTLLFHPDSQVISVTT